MDRIEILNIRASGKHGANPGERDREQPFIIDVRIEMDLRLAATSDMLEATLDYDALHQRIVTIVRTTSFELLERLAAELLTTICADSRVARAEVKVAKPDLLDGATPSITLVRENHRHRAYIGIGSNLQGPSENVRTGIAALEGLGEVVARSSLYRAQPWGGIEQPEYANAVVLLRTSLAPHELLTALKRLEAELGRTPTIRWGPRIIDFDILTYDDIAIDETIDGRRLQIPHPRMHERAFVLVPLAEIDAGFALARDALTQGELNSVELFARN